MENNDIIARQRQEIDAANAKLLKAESEVRRLGAALRAEQAAYGVRAGELARAYWALRQISQLVPGQSNVTAIFMAMNSTPSSMQHPHTQGDPTGFLQSQEGQAALESYRLRATPVGTEAGAGDDLSLKELAEQFHAVAELGGAYVISPASARKLFDAMTMAPASAAQPAAPQGPIDANELEKMSTAHPGKCFLTGRGVLKLIGAIRTLEQRAAAPLPLPAGPSDRDLEQRAIGRSEAAAIVLQMDPEADLFEGCFGSCALADTGDYSTHWLDDKVHEVFRTADTAWSMLKNAEGEYYEREGLLAETRVMHAEARQLRGLDWNNRNDIEAAAKAVAESNDSLSKRLYDIAHAAQNAAHDAYCSSAPVAQPLAASAAPEGVSLKSFQAADDKSWWISIQHPFGTTSLLCKQRRDLQLAELLAAAPRQEAQPAVQTVDATRADIIDFLRASNDADAADRVAEFLTTAQIIKNIAAPSQHPAASEVTK